MIIINLLFCPPRLIFLNQINGLRHFGDRKIQRRKTSGREQTCFTALVYFEISKSKVSYNYSMDKICFRHRVLHAISIHEMDKKD